MELTVSLPGGLAVEHRADLGDALRDELLTRAGVDAIHPAPAAAARGTKSGGLLEWGTVLVSVASAASVRTLIDALSSWLRRQPPNITVEVDGTKVSGVLTGAQRDRLIDAVVERLHRSGGPEPDQDAPTGGDAP